MGVDNEVAFYYYINGNKFANKTAYSIWFKSDNSKYVK